MTPEFSIADIATAACSPAAVSSTPDTVPFSKSCVKNCNYLVLNEKYVLPISKSSPAASSSIAGPAAAGSTAAVAVGWDPPIT